MGGLWGISCPELAATQHAQVQGCFALTLPLLVLMYLNHQAAQLLHHSNTEYATQLAAIPMCTMPLRKYEESANEKRAIPFIARRTRGVGVL